MRTRNNEINLDRAKCAADNASKEAMQPASETTESPATAKESRWTRRRIGVLAGLALTGIATLLTPVQIKAAIFTIDVITSWAIGEGLTAGKNALLNANGGASKAPLARLSPTAKAVANTAYWLSNSYDYTHKVDEWNYDTIEWNGNWTTTTVNASQLRQDNNESLSGTNSDGTAMRQAEAKGYLLHSRASYTSVQIELFTTDYDPKERYLNGHPYDGWLEDIWLYGRTDSLDQIKQAKLNALKTEYEDPTLYWGPEFEKSTTVYNVGDYEMESKFENVTGHAALSDSSPDDSRAKHYKGTVKWTYNDVNPDGTSKYPGIDDYSDYDFKSHEPDTDWVAELCKNNQSLSIAPDINNSARRRFENQRYKVRKYGPIPLHYRMAPSRPILTVGWYWEDRIKRVVVQEED